LLAWCWQVAASGAGAAGLYMEPAAIYEARRLRTIFVTLAVFGHAG
jgi:hypothetical protein